MEKVWLFGASGYGRRAYAELKTKFEIKGFLDNDKNKWGGVELAGCKVFPPDVINGMDDVPVIVASSYADEIAVQLKEMGRKDYWIYPSLELDSSGRYPDKKLCRELDKAVLKLYAKLRECKNHNLPISDYNKKYLGSKSLQTLFVYSGILYTVLSEKKCISTLLEYGGGTGLISLLAAEYGIPNIYYNDIYDVSCKDAEIIADHMGLKRDGYICGDIAEVLEFSQQRNLVFEAVVSYDVIEHIYDLKNFYRVLREVMAVNGITCMESGANSYNPAFMEQAASQHLKIDFLDRPRVCGHKERDCLRAYYEVRIELIGDYAGQNGYEIKQAEKVALAFLSRGMMRCDIEKAVEDYVRKGELPVLDPFFAYNTCDPNTGNWAEHIINYDGLKSDLEEMGYRVRYAFQGEKENSPTIQIIAM